MNTRRIGADGEEVAVKYLLDNGHTILTRNFRKRGFEIDIVSKKDDVICFVEVKTVIYGSLEDAVHSVETRNIRRYFCGVESFMMKNPSYKNNVMSMDLIIVTSDRVHYYSNITGLTVM